MRPTGSKMPKPKFKPDKHPGKGKPKAKGRGKHKGKGKGKKKRPNELYEPSSLLRQKSLKRGARALTRMELKPQIGAYRRLAEQLERQKGAEAGGIEALGNRTAGNVSSVYQQLAQSQAQNVARQQAIGGQLNQQMGANAQQAQEAVTQAQTGQLGAYQEAMQLRGAPGGGQAQQQLANMVASQQQRQAETNQAQQNLAASQAASYGQLASSQAAAEQSRGAEAQRDIRTGISSRIAESNLKHNLDISEARGKIAETKALRGPTMTKNILDLREKERDFSLGLAATRTDQSKMALDAKKAARTARETGRHNRATEGLSAAGERRQRRENRREARQEAREGKSGNKKAVRNIKSAAQNSAKLAGGWPDTPQEIAAMVEDVRSKVGGADISLVRRIVKQLAGRRG